MTTETLPRLIEAITLNVFASDSRLSKYGPADRAALEEELSGLIGDVIGQFIGENGDVHEH